MLDVFSGGRVSWIGCMSSAFLTHWWKSTPSPGYKRFTHTKVRVDPLWHCHFSLLLCKLHLNPHRKRFSSGKTSLILCTSKAEPMFLPLFSMVNAIIYWSVRHHGSSRGKYLDINAWLLAWLWHTNLPNILFLFHFTFHFIFSVCSWPSLALFVCFFYSFIR